MSADLFAAFGSDTGSEPQAPAAQTKSIAPRPNGAAPFGGLTPSSGPTAQKPVSAQIVRPAQSFSYFGVRADPHSTIPEEETDDWGDFEGNFTVETGTSIPQQVIKTPSSSAAQFQQPRWTPADQNEVPKSSSTTQGNQPSTFGWQSAPIVKAKKPADSAILFDAEDEDDDDFGDFEGVNETAAPTVSQSQSALVDLMGDMNMSQAQATPAAAIDRSRNSTAGKKTAKKSNSMGGFGNTAQVKPKPGKVGAPASQIDDRWDTFDDWEASVPTKPATKAEPPKLSTATPDTKATAQLPSATLTFDEPQPGELPPTNVPPPGVLLSLFPSLFNVAQEKLFKPMAAQPPPMRNKLMAEPATIAFLQGYLVLADVAARLIAGRKLRWKRDQHLSQGMRIGPASSRATSGMKLTGIDKGENMKEEREVADVVRVWKDQVGRLRHVVSGINQIKNGTLATVPDLNDVLPVKTLKQNEGGVPARTPCMLCGLKRDERVTVSDLKTEDSFGEWWVDGVSMHRGEFPL